jgi:hypothetical protein
MVPPPTDSDEPKRQLQAEVCTYNVTEWYGNPNTLNHTINQGESIYQVTTGNAAKPQYSICTPRMIPAKWMYAENINWAWTQVRVQSDSLTLLSQGVNNPQNAPIPLY